MTLPYHASQFIVGFRDFFLLDDFQNNNFSSPEQMAESTLRRTQGFVDVLLRFPYLNAVLVKVDPLLADVFFNNVKYLDHVEYCENDYYLESCGYTDVVHPAHLKGVPQERALNVHRLGSGRCQHGLGMKIALIDTGISPHPYLPALSFGEVREKYKTWHSEWCSNNTFQFAFSLFTLERRYANAYTDTVARFSFNSDLDSYVSSFVDAKWSEWTLQLQQWQARQRTPPRPDFPRCRGLFGALRVISPKSWNVVDDNPNVLDTDGHGTSMAGCISALPPISVGVLPNISPYLNTEPSLKNFPYASSLATTEQEITGLAPYAELMIFKCSDSSNADASTMSKLNLALGKCIDNSPDIVYIGFSVRSEDQKKILSVTRLTALVRAAGILMFAPAGNEGTAELPVPAGCPDVLAITAADVQASGFPQRSSFSSFADSANHEKIAFCAYGGSDKTPMLLLSREFGFAYDYGTSISAAVAAAACANTFALTYLRSVGSIYDAHVNARGQIKPTDVRYQIENWKASTTDINDVLSRMKATALKPLANPNQTEDPEHGYGLVRF